jgi:DNA invertase Pin-like site-specific DNA recombinase
MARVSTVEQADLDERFSLPLQLKQARAHAEANEFEVVAEFVEPGVSGAKALKDRPVIQDMLLDAARKKFEAVVWPKLDRLSRSVRHGTELIAQLQEQGIEVLVAQEGINTTSVMGKAMLQIMFVLAELERSLIAERTTTVLIEKANANPRMHPGGRLAFAYQTDNDGNIIADEDAAKVLRVAYERVAAGEPVNAVTDYFNGEGVPGPRGAKWRSSSLWNILRNEAYWTGRINWTKSIGEGAAKVTVDLVPREVPILVDEGLWRKANAELDKRARTVVRRGSAEAPAYALSGRVTHEHENGSSAPLYAAPRPVYLRKKNSETGKIEVQRDEDGKAIVKHHVRTYRCSDVFAKATADNCSGMGLARNGAIASSIHGSQLEAKTILAVLQAIEDEEAFTKLVGALPAGVELADEVAHQRERLDELAARRKRTAVLFEEGLDDRKTFDAKLAAIADEEARIEQRLAELDADYDPQEIAAVVAQALREDAAEMAPFELINHLNVARLALGEQGLEGTDLLTLVGIDAAAVVEGRSRDLHQTSITWLARTAQRLDVRAIITDSTERFEVELGSTRIEVREEPSATEGNEFCIQ